MQRSVLTIVFILVLCASVGFSQVTGAQVKSEPDSTAQEDHPSAIAKKKKSKGKKFADLIEGYEVIKGLFTFYRNQDEGKVYLEIKPDQLDKIYLCSITREAGEGSLFDSGAILGQFPFFFQRVGKRVQFIEKNLRVRAAPDNAIARAVERDVSNSLRGSAKIASEPHPDRGSLLVDAAELFVKDIGQVGHATGRAKMSYSLDKTNSYISKIKSFAFNSDLEVTLYFSSSKPRPLFTLADSRSMIHRYYYSLSEIPENNYRPRAADDRLGHFYTMFQDYTSLLRDDPYQRYINRWNLEKSEPRFKISRPKKPVVFWLENTIPTQYRQAVRQGVLLWNAAFEKIGFQDALEVRQMPDDAGWDPADVRYNTIRWIIRPGKSYAMGPFRANPYTGQIYDADIRISADLLRNRYLKLEEFITPAAGTPYPRLPFLADFFSGEDATAEMTPSLCAYAEGLWHQVAFGQNLLLAGNSDNKISPEVLETYLEEAIISLVAHEVGHTLGLRHNFKASTMRPLSEIEERRTTGNKALSGSIMDYFPVNVSGKKEQRDNFFQTRLGPYDYWAIEYAYRPYPLDSRISEKEMLAKIARRAAEAGLQYGSDEDAFGLSSRAVDPTCNLWDLGEDPLEYYAHRLALTQKLWSGIDTKVEDKFKRYTKLRQMFNQGIAEYALAGLSACKFIGGLYHHRDHIGDPHGRPPFTVVPAEKQRRALNFLIKNFFAPASFHFSPAVLNKLAPERLWDFEGTVMRLSRLDYPIHGIVQLLQAVTLLRLYNPLALARMQDNELRFSESDNGFTMAELFRTLRQAIWEEISTQHNIGSFRRELQRIHLSILSDMLLKRPPGFPHDAITLARAAMGELKKSIESLLVNGNFDTYTRAHLEESLAKINASLEAGMMRR